MKGSAGVLALVLAETVGGAAAFVFLMPLWNEVRRGFFKLTGFIVLALAAALWAAVASARQPGSDAGRWALWLSAAFAIATALWLLALFVRLHMPARIIGIATVPLSIGLLTALAGTSDESWAVSFLQLLAGMAFMGAVIDGLLLGHWYLTDRKLTRAPINRFALALIVAVVLEAAAVIAGGFGPNRGNREFSALLTAAGLAPWVALGMIGTTALIAGMIKATLRGERATAVQAATGFFYLAVITAFAGELAAKVRFLP
ncbi:MAG: hypothetical protein ABR600_04095 [Actinomycetota bacterium]